MKRKLAPQRFRLTPEEMRARDLAIERDAAEADESEKPLVAKIREAGWQIDSVWDLVNFHTDHAALAPLLLDHLPRDYHPKIKMAIARALINAGPASERCSQVLVAELKRSLTKQGGQWEGVQQSISCALRKLADRCVVNELREIAEQYKGRFLYDDLAHAIKRCERKR